MIKTIFETAGVLQLEALTILGLSAKPASQNPIGMFGTGLKYAIAILARESIEVEIFTGGKHWKVTTHQAGFRGNAYTGIKLQNCNNPSEQIPLPFTVELGKNWELWQAYRELACNTVDEQGTIYNEEHAENPFNISNNTYIVVYGEEFAKFCDNPDEVVFLNNSLPLLYSTSDVGIWDAPSDYLFYRGIRIMSLPHTSLFTYNVLSPLKLTEDRTVPESEMSSIKWAIKTAVKQTKDTKLLTAVLNCGENDWENCLTFDINEWTRKEYSSEFKAVGENCKNPLISRAIYQTSPAYLQAKKDKANEVRNRHYLKTLLDCIEAEKWDKFKTVAEINAEKLAEVLADALDSVQE